MDSPAPRRERWEFRAVNLIYPRKRLVSALTWGASVRHTGKTTLCDGTTAPRKSCGFFMPAFLAPLATHRGASGAAHHRVSKPVGSRLTRRNKADSVCTNKPGRSHTVVDAPVPPPISLSSFRGDLAGDSTISTLENCHA